MIVHCILYNVHECIHHGGTAAAYPSHSKCNILYFNFTQDISMLNMSSLWIPMHYTYVLKAIINNSIKRARNIVRIIIAYKFPLWMSNQKLNADYFGGALIDSFGGWVGGLYRTPSQPHTHILLHREYHELQRISNDSIWVCCVRLCLCIVDVSLINRIEW